MDIDNKTETELEEFEGDIVKALLESAAYQSDKSELRLISIVRNDKLMFKFKIRPLNEDEWDKCRKQNLKNRGKRNERVDSLRFSSQAIYMATIEEDRAKIWDNKAAWQALNVASGIDAIGAILKPGEKARIIEEIENLSGYNDDLDALIKNA